MFVPSEPSYTREAAAKAIAGSSSWAEALRRLGLAPRGKNESTLKKSVETWGIPVSHLPPSMPGRAGPAFTEDQARAAIAASSSWAEALRRLGYCDSGGNSKTLKKWTGRWLIDTGHFDAAAARRAALARVGPKRRPLREILVEHSEASRSMLKERLYEAGLKERVCELCGQDEVWLGRRLSLIIDHVSGVRDDNRLENLRIVCPNCAATLDTHCGRKHPRRLSTRECLRCGLSFQPKRHDQRYCSSECGSRWDRSAVLGAPNERVRRVERPPHDQLLAEIKRLGFCAVGRKYGVSDNAIRKWVRQYERQKAISAGRDPRTATVPRRTWPNRRRNAA